VPTNAAEDIFTPLSIFSGRFFYFAIRTPEKNATSLAKMGCVNGRRLVQKLEAGCDWEG
jgi:hypothetical protein